MKEHHLQAISQLSEWCARPTEIYISERDENSDFVVVRSNGWRRAIYLRNMKTFVFRAMVDDVIWNHLNQYSRTLVHYTLEG